MNIKMLYLLRNGHVSIQQTGDPIHEYLVVKTLNNELWCNQEIEVTHIV
jgi:hypothetical protein